MVLINCMGRDVTIRTREGTTFVLPGSHDRHARLVWAGKGTIPISVDAGTIAVMESIRPRIKDLPDPTPDTLYLVAPMVAQWARRPDVVAGNEAGRFDPGYDPAHPVILNLVTFAD